MLASKLSLEALLRVMIELPVVVVMVVVMGSEYKSRFEMGRKPGVPSLPTNLIVCHLNVSIELSSTANFFLYLCCRFAPFK